jgi:2-desacetyl-2-hydroxyethyl bacteriochlorophyllide A dehydrogenase
VRVQTILSAISPGTEMLVYKGQVPVDMAVDETIPALEGVFNYPLRYGYSAVGRVVEVGASVDPNWIGRLVFAFNPHETVFNSDPARLIKIPKKIEPEDALFLPNLETAVGFLMDGQPVIGERVIVFGQGIVGVLTTHLLSQFPLDALATVDPYPGRRALSNEIGATISFDPENPGFLDDLRTSFPVGADLTYEVSGVPDALDQAIRATRFNGRVVIGSWYGIRPVRLDLGGYFHRSRIRLISSQVSTLEPAFTGRWDRRRGDDRVWRQIHHPSFFDLSRSRSI